MIGKPFHNIRKIDLKKKIMKMFHLEIAIEINKFKVYNWF